MDQYDFQGVMDVRRAHENQAREQLNAERRKVEAMTSEVDSLKEELRLTKLKLEGAESTLAEIRFFSDSMVGASGQS